jgi:hypothetical protein
VVDVIGNIYDAAPDEKLWVDISGAIAAAFERAEHRASTARHASRRYQSALNDQELRCDGDRVLCLVLLAVHPWVERALKLDPSTVFANKDLIDENDLIKSEIYNDLCRPLGIFHLVGALFPVGNGAFGELAFIVRATRRRSRNLTKR